MIARHFILWLLCLAAAIVSLAWQLVAIVSSPRRAMRIAIGFDQTANAAFGGDEDETISARCWRLREGPLHSALDVRTESPAGCYTPNIAAEFVEVPDDVETGWTLSGDNWSAPVIPEPVIPEPVAPVPPTVGPVRFKMLFTSAERRKAKELRATDAVMDDFWGLLDDCIATDSPVDLSLTSVQQAVGYTLLQVKDAGVTVDVAARTAAILNGEVA